jgi:ferric-dicitrate binding protein FerR (iron transport regulator)
VRRYAADDTTRIAVLSGKVVSGGRGMPLTIAAGFAAHVTDSTASETPVSNLRQYVDWTHGELIFQRTPVPVLLTTLGRWYGYQFRLIDSTMAQSDVSAVFKVSDPADMFLVLRGTLNVTMTFDGNVITLARRRDTKHAPQMPARRDVFKPSMEIGR